MVIWRTKGVETLTSVKRDECTGFSFLVYTSLKSIVTSLEACIWQVKYGEGDRKHEGSCVLMSEVQSLLDTNFFDFRKDFQVEAKYRRPS
ncbi:hypothetical protein DPMN_090575 [Dreissena polymorpha]|uniref:Uncharacterized protein n=1 Tax=Dreissena polymorpha TaxID=45954 RepID=A0A9D4L0F1_DREPO|nr:hypothetical protein DPMN_090575 [Dreissena polymorpha]